MNILITGGHLTPALSFIDQIQAEKKDKFFFVGRKYSQPKLKQVSHELEEIKKRKIDFFYLNAVRISELKSIFFIFALVKLLFSIGQASSVIKKTKPDVILSFGGYLALPVAIAGYLKKVPVITHEQTRSMGVANKMIAKFSSAVAISYSESKKEIEHKNIVLTGNPIRKYLFDSVEKPSWLDLDKSKPILYITGGNQGSRAINRFIGQIIEQLTVSWNVVHQCGNPTSENNYLAELEQKKAKLTKEHQLRYSIRNWISDQELAWIYQHADLVISRSGANSISELEAFALPAILIPLPNSYQNEQQINAEHFLKNNNGILLPEKDLTRDLLSASISQIMKKKRINKSFKYNPTIVENIYKLLLSVTDEQ